MENIAKVFDGVPFFSQQFFQFEIMKAELEQMNGSDNLT
jgi:hypothetical protein